MIRSIPIRLYSVKGYENRCNDVIYCPPIQTGFNSVVVFFGGDIQDFSENMKSHRDNKNYLKWNLEDSTLRLRKKFPKSHLITIRPSRFEYKTISCYNNFVPSNNCGAPNHIPMNFALEHLQKILENASEKLRNMTEEELNESTKFYEQIESNNEGIKVNNEEIQSNNEEIKSNNEEINNEQIENKTWREDLNLQNYDLTAIGFSKGCVVLNQFLYEFNELKNQNGSNQDIISKIKDLYWLDGGHSGGKNTWITSKTLLETLSQLNINIHVHVTPYQIQDDRRPWIRKEEKTFSDSLKRLKAPIVRSVHFENVPPSLFTHFEVLNTFKDDEQIS